MKLISQLLAFNIFLLTSLCIAGPTQQIPGLLSPQYAISIKPTDFSAGPVVITEPGYYILTNDIVFNPAAPNNVDSVGNPWNAALIILADCVTLDLNTHSIQQSTSFDSSKFKLIQVGGINPFNPSTTATPQKQITIKNGCLGRSQGYGIYGKDNSNVSIYDLSICSCNIAGIFLQNLQCSTIQNVCISGSTSGAGNVYGIFLRDNNTTTPEWTSDYSGTSGPSGVTLENIKICDVFTDNSLTTDDEIVDLLCTARNKIDISTLNALQPCVDASIQACLALLNPVITQLLLLIDVAKAVPNQVNIDAILTYKASAAFTTAIDCFETAFGGIGSPTAEDLLFIEAFEQFQACLDIACDLIEQANNLSDGQRDFINGVSTSTAWHAYGIRVTNGHGIELKNCFVTDTTVDSAVTDVTRAVAIALDQCKGCTLINCFTNASSVNLGAAIGFSFAAVSQGNLIDSCTSTSHSSNDESYGYWSCDTKSQNFISCEASAITGQNISKGFFFELSNSTNTNSANNLKQCKAHGISCSRINATDSAQAIGFDSVGGTCNVFDACEAYNITADLAFQDATYDSGLLAAGFRLKDSTSPARNDVNSVISNSTARCIEGSGGDSNGILLSGTTCSTVRKNTTASNQSVNSVGAVIGNGYGIHDTALDTTTLIVENLAYANQTFNYKVLYGLENEQLPVVNSTYGDMTSIFVASVWQNISLFANPGANGCNAECTMNPEQP